MCTRIASILAERKREREERREEAKRKGEIKKKIYERKLEIENVPSSFECVYESGGIINIIYRFAFFEGTWMHFPSTVLSGSSRPPAFWYLPLHFLTAVLAL